MTTAAYLLVLTAWLAVIAYMLPAVYAIYIKRTRHGDPARLICFGFGLLMTGFLARRSWHGEPIDESMAALLSLSIVMAIATIWTARTYGRGPIVQDASDV